MATNPYDPPATVAKVEASQSPITDRPRAQRCEIVSWALCDWANSAYSTLLITILVSYLQSYVLPGDAGVLAYGWGLGVSMFLAAWLAPIFGAMADARANKRTWLLTTSYLGAAGGVLMGVIPTGWPWMFVALFFVTTLAFELAFGFYNSFLPELSDEATMNRNSGYGFAAGYLGGGVALLAAILLLRVGGSNGMSIETGLRAGLVLMGVWWGVFMLPAVFFLRDKAQPQKPAGLLTTARAALREVFRTLSHIRSYSMLALFLLGFLLYNEGIQTVMSQASVFANKVLEMEPAELAMVVLMIQFLATPAALGVGWISDRAGPKQTLLGCLLVWCGVLIAAYFVRERWQFWLLGVVLALVMGGTQSVSRAIMGLMTPPAKTAEFFGFFNLSARATSMIGPILFAQILVLTGSANAAIVSLLIFIVAGGVAALAVNLRRGIEQAKAG